MKSGEWRVEGEVLGAQEPIKEGDCSGADPLSRHEVRDGVSGDVRDKFFAFPAGRSLCAYQNTAGRIKPAA